MPQIKGTFYRTYTDAVLNYNAEDEVSQAVDNLQHRVSPREGVGGTPPPQHIIRQRKTCFSLTAFKSRTYCYLTRVVGIPFAHLAVGS